MSAWSATIEQKLPPTERDSELVRDGLNAFNDARVATDWCPVVFHLVEESGQVVGGLTGDMYLRRLRIETLWIDERYRRRGHGRALLEAAEEFGRSKGCVVAQLSTFEFQAGPVYYERRGYSVFGSVAPGGESPAEYFLSKRLGQ